MTWTINTSIIMQGVSKLWVLSEFQVSLISLNFVVGMFLGSYFWGILADIYGRMFSFKKTVIFALLGGIGLTVSPSVEWVYISNLVTGFGVGGEIALGGTVLAEFTPPSRNWLIGLLCMFWSLGGAISALLALMFQFTGEAVMWRWVCGICAGTEFLFLFLRWNMPETPFWLYNQERYTEAHSVMKKVQKKNQTDHFDLNYFSFDSFISGTGFQESKSSIILKIFGKVHIRTTLIMSLIYFLGNFAFAALVYFMPMLIKQSSSEESTTFVWVIILIQQAAGIPGNFLAAWLMESSLGRKWLLVVASLVTSVLTFLFLMANGVGTTLLFSSLMMMCSYLTWSVAYTVTPESYPTEIRNSGVGWANTCAKFGGIVAPPLMGVLMELESGFVVSLVGISGVFVAIGLLCSLIKEKRVMKD